MQSGQRSLAAEGTDLYWYYRVGIANKRKSTSSTPSTEEMNEYGKEIKETSSTINLKEGNAPGKKPLTNNTNKTIGKGSPNGNPRYNRKNQLQDFLAGNPYSRLDGHTESTTRRNSLLFIQKSFLLWLIAFTSMKGLGQDSYDYGWLMCFSPKVEYSLGPKRTERIKR